MIDNDRVGRSQETIPKITKLRWRNSMIPGSPIKADMLQKLIRQLNTRFDHTTKLMLRSVVDVRRMDVGKTLSDPIDGQPFVGRLGGSFATCDPRLRFTVRNHQVLNVVNDHSRNPHRVSATFTIASPTVIRFGMCQLRFDHAVERTNQFS